MTLKDKLKSYNFWISLVSAIILFLTVLGNKFNFEIDPSLIIDLSTALCSIFVILGIISVPKKTTTNPESTQTEVESLSTQDIKNDIKETLSTYLNDSFSNSITELLDNFSQLKQSMSFNLNTDNKSEETEPEISNLTLEEKHEEEKETNETSQETCVINQEIAQTFTSPVETDTQILEANSNVTVQSTKTV